MDTTSPTEVHRRWGENAPEDMESEAAQVPYFLSRLSAAAAWERYENEKRIVALEFELAYRKLGAYVMQTDPQRIDLKKQESAERKQKDCPCIQENCKYDRYPRGGLTPAMRRLQRKRLKCIGYDGQREPQTKHRPSWKPGTLLFLNCSKCKPALCECEKKKKKKRTCQQKRVPRQPSRSQ